MSGNGRLDLFVVAMGASEVAGQRKRGGWLPCDTIITARDTAGRGEGGLATGANPNGPAATGAGTTRSLAQRGKAPKGQRV